jgi:hypothetical protein
MDEQTNVLPNISGGSAVVPAEVKKWNWGAFLLSWIWGIGNRTYIAFLMFVPFVNFVMIFVLGAKGSEWAWKNKHWDSVDDFKRVQKKWAYAGLAVLAAGIAIAIVATVIAFKLTSPPVQSADVFFGQLTSGQVDAAYASTADKFKNVGTEDQFKSFLQDSPILTEVASENFNDRSIVGSDATLKGTITGMDGSSSPITIDEVQEGGQWKISGLELQ